MRQPKLDIISASTLLYEFRQCVHDWISPVVFSIRRQPRSPACNRWRRSCSNILRGVSVQASRHLHHGVAVRYDQDHEQLQMARWPHKQLCVSFMGITSWYDTRVIRINFCSLINDTKAVPRWCAYVCDDFQTPFELSSVGAAKLTTIFRVEGLKYVDAIIL